MQGTILILDAIATNRIMLKVQLSAAYYHVVQMDRLENLARTVRHARPDLIITAMNLPDGNALDLQKALHSVKGGRDIPVLAVTAENDGAARLRALNAGLDDVMSQPLIDKLLQARIRRLMRARADASDMPVQPAAETRYGLQEATAAFVTPARVALLTWRAETSCDWHARLAGHMTTPVEFQEKHDAIDAGLRDAIDAYVIEITRDPKHGGLNLLADLRARARTRNAVVLAVINPPDPDLAAEALDRGAHDVLQAGFCAEELAIRLESQLKRKAEADEMRASVLKGLRAAMVDPMTGLYNRRYAMPHLDQIVEEACRDDSNFAVMIADLDHFKQINDRYGHQTGDAVLIEAAMRLRQRLRPCDMIARIGGEEFLIVMPDTDKSAAVEAADRLCRQINAKPFWVRGSDQSIPVTISIGLVVGNPGAAMSCSKQPDAANTLINQADRALYEAKDGGRNKVTIIPPAA